MKPYYDEGGITLYCGDCREVLPQLQPDTFDIMLTDPPYGVGKGYKSYDDTADELKASLIPLLFSVDVPKLITCGVGNLWSYPPADWVICWYKPNAMTRAGVANANTWEPVLVYGCKGFGVDSVYVPISPQPFDHPCPKPEPLFAWLLARAMKRKGLVFDPFVGSGTTLVVAKRLGMTAIGIELEERYCEIAAKRCQQEPMVLENTEPQPQQAEMF